MGVPRYSELILPPEFYVDYSDAIVEKIGKAMFEIEKRGFGKAQLESVAHKLALRLPEGGHSFFDLPDVPFTRDDQGEVATAVAEWADGDTVACHIGYGNDLFCSGDKGGKTGTRSSILNKANREWLSGTYGLQFVYVQELAERLPTLRAF